MIQQFSDMLGSYSEDSKLTVLIARPV